MKKLLTLLLALLIVFTLVGCNSKQEQPPVVEEPEQQEVVVEQKQEEPEIVGGYVNVDDGTITPELNGIFTTAMQGLLGASYEPVKLVATQVVAGTNYKFLANGTKTTNPVTKGTYYIYINEDLQGNISLLDIEVIEEKQEEVKTQDVTNMSFWVVFYDQYGNELQREALKYGTIPSFKGTLPEGFDKWDKSLKAITGNTYIHAVCHKISHSSGGSSFDPTPTPTPISIKYLDWNGTKLVEKETSVYTEITNSTTTLSSGFYVVKGNVSTDTLTVNGTPENPTYLILCNGATLTATASDDDYSGITVMQSKGLIITTPKGGNGMLTSNGGDNSSGIGGGDGKSGLIIINGGNITAKGGDGDGGAGIGSGEMGGPGAGQKIIINGGTIEAYGGSGMSLGGAGIGGGSSATNVDCVIEINGGIVKAYGGKYAAGIGGGHKGNGGTITINGGAIEAYGGDQGSGIGFGYDSTSNATVNINGGSITTTGGDAGTGVNGKGIGGDITYNPSKTFVIKAGSDSTGTDSTYTGQKYVNIEVSSSPTPSCTITYSGDSSSYFSTAPTSAYEGDEVTIVTNTDMLLTIKYNGNNYINGTFNGESATFTYLPVANGSEIKFNMPAYDVVVDVIQI